MGRTYEAMLRAQRERERAVAAPRRQEDAGGPPRLEEDLAAVLVAVQALEDRLETELPVLRDELRETIAKSADVGAQSAAVRERDLGGQLESLRASVERNARCVVALGAIALLLAVLRC